MKHIVSVKVNHITRSTIQTGIVICDHILHESGKRTDGWTDVLFAGWYTCHFRFYHSVDVCSCFSFNKMSWNWKMMSAYTNKLSLWYISIMEQLQKQLTTPFSVHLMDGWFTEWINVWTQYTLTYWLTYIPAGVIV